MRPANFPVMFIVLGLLLFAASFVYPQWSGSARREWTDDDAQEFLELSKQIHGMSRPPSKRPNDPNALLSPEDARLLDSYLQKEQKLRDAQQAGEGVARVLYWLGIGLVCVGGFCYLATRSDGD